MEKTMKAEIFQSQPKLETVTARFREWNRRRLYNGKHRTGVKQPDFDAGIVFQTKPNEYATALFPENLPSSSWASRVEDRLTKEALGNFSIQIGEPTSEIPSLYSPDERFR